MARLARKSPRKSPKRPLNPDRLPRRFARLPPTPARRTSLSVTQTKAGALPLCSRSPPPPPGPRAAPSLLAKNVTARLQGSRGIGRPEERGEEQGLGAAEAAPGRLVVKDQCPGHGWRRREWAQALHPPGFVKRCTAKGQLEMVSWPGPLSSPPPTPGQGLISARFPSTLQAAGVASSPPSSPPASSSPTPGKAVGEGPYLRIDFGVLRRCAAAQAAQKHQQQRQQLRPCSRLPAAKETARPARPSGRAPVAAHAHGARPLAGAGSLHAARNLRLPGSPPEPRQIPTAEEKRAGQVRARGAGPLGRGRAGVARRGVLQPRRPGPG